MIDWIKEKYRRWRWCRLTGFSPKIYDELKSFEEFKELNEKQAQFIIERVSDYTGFSRDNISVYVTPHGYGIEIPKARIDVHGRSIPQVMKKFIYTYSQYYY